MPHVKIAFLGFGNVGQALAALLERKRQELKQNYDITFTATGVATARHGKIVNQIGLDLNGASQLVRSGNSLNLMTKTLSFDSLDFIMKCGADVLFENTPVNHTNGQPAIQYIQTALDCNMHVITANKGPVVHAYQALTEQAARQGRRFLFESTVMDGAPIFSLFRETLPASRLKALRGILNSTTNLILSRMEKGESYDEAVKYAQSIGIAETDPSSDVDGWDAAIKVAALCTVLMGIPLTPQQVVRTGIREINAEKIAAARAQGRRWKLVCKAWRDGDRAVGTVAPEMVTANSPLFSVNGTSSIVEFQTDTLSRLAIVENDPGPETTAYGLLADFINAVRKH